MKRLVILLTTLFLTLPLFVAGRALAHGIGTAQRINVSAGPYLASVWTDPDPLRVNETHVTVAIMDPVTQEPLVRDMQVTVQLQPATDESVTLSTSAVPDNTANRLLYAAVFNNLPHPGQWRGTVSIDGPAGAGEDVRFEIDVLAPQPVKWGLIGGLALAIITVAWLAWSWRGRPRTAERPSQRAASTVAARRASERDER